jgi:hypothetical protein
VAHKAFELRASGKRGSCGEGGIPTAHQRVESAHLRPVRGLAEKNAGGILWDLPRDVLGRRELHSETGRGGRPAVSGFAKRGL